MIELNDDDFHRVISNTGARPNDAATQNTTRHYSETFSREVALWLRSKLISRNIGSNVLPPEGKVDTIYGIGNRGKSLDVAVLNDSRYLMLNISIKTFNFKDRATKNYRHNYTGRFYELLGEDLDLRRSYEYATLVALILLPEDSISDSNPSSFAHAVRQFSKIIKKDDADKGLGFDYVYIGVHSADGKIYFFDAREFPPRTGEPKEENKQSVSEIIKNICFTVAQRETLIATAKLPVYLPYNFTEPI